MTVTLSPLRSNTGCGAMVTSTRRSPLGPPRSPEPPLPLSRIRAPLRTPAGIRACTVRELRPRPEPWQLGHGSSTNRPAAAAGDARVGEGEAAGVARRLARPVAGRAHARDGARLGARAVAAGAGRVGRQPQRDGDAVQRIVERQRQRALEVLPATRLRGASPAAATAVEDAAQEVAEATGVLPEQVLHVDVVLLAPAAVPAAAAGTEAAAREQGPGLVVLLALGVVGQHVVRLGDLLEPLLGRLVARVLVRVELAGQLAVLLLDLVGRGVLGHAEHGVEVLLEPVLVHGRFPASVRQSVPATATRAGRSTRSA